MPLEKKKVSVWVVQNVNRDGLDGELTHAIKADLEEELREIFMARDKSHDSTAHFSSFDEKSSMSLARVFG